MGWLAPVECMCCDCAGCRSVSRNQEIWGASFVFWVASVDCVDVCSREADSQWRALSVVCPTGDIWCAEDLCDRILGVALLCVVITVMTSSGVCVCVAKITRLTKPGCQRWVGNCVKRRGEFYISGGSGGIVSLQSANGPRFLESLGAGHSGSEHSGATVWYHATGAGLLAIHGRECSGPHFIGDVDVTPTSAILSHSDP